MLMRSTSLASATDIGKFHRVHETVVSSAVETIFRETAQITSLYAKAMARKANRASHGPRVLAKERANKVRKMENPKENPKVPRVSQVL